MYGVVCLGKYYFIYFISFLCSHVDAVYASGGPAAQCYFKPFFTNMMLRLKLLHKHKTSIPNLANILPCISEVNAVK